MEKINSSSWKAFSLSFCMAMTACAGGQDVPTQGRLVDKVTPASSYPVAPTTQALLDPANNSVTGVLVAPEVTAYPQGIIDRLLATWTGPKPDAKVWLVPEDSFTSDVSSNGAIFLNTGLIRYFHDHADVQKEDALAFVLAH
ncbi:MAG TPA: hypothetical protein DEP42_04010, partial [Ruminococcaceae bacterium]|nr:hypothetical protein [Oscillospiraceae bacterium]